MADNKDNAITPGKVDAKTGIDTPVKSDLNTPDKGVIDPSNKDGGIDLLADDEGEGTGDNKERKARGPVNEKLAQVRAMAKLLKGQEVEISRAKAMPFGAGYEFFARINGKVYRIDGFKSFANMIVVSGVGGDNDGVSTADVADNYIKQQAS